LLLPMLSWLLLLGLVSPPSALAIEIAPSQICKRVSAAEGELVASGLSPTDAAKELQAQLVAADLVESSFNHLSNHPTGKSLARESLWSAAVEQVQSKLGHEAPPEMQRALQRLKERGAGLLTDVNRGQRQLRDLSKYLMDPTEALKGPETTPAEDYTIATLALTRLLKGDPANASHVMDLLQAAQDPKVRAAFEAAGITPLQMARDILLHDLGKQYNDPHLASYRAFLETVFPEASTNFLSTKILPHEFGSMIILAELAKEAGIPENKIPRLQALLARHNAGYSPDLKGFHFWVTKWGEFAKEMQAAGVPLPETYGAVSHVANGGHKETVALTAIDRGVSMTLASQEKFSMLLVNTSNWNAQAMAGLLLGNVKNVPAEINSVVARMKDGKVQSALIRYFNEQGKITAALGERLKELEPLAPAPDGIAGSSIAYQTKDQTWYRVSDQGKAYQWNGKGWDLHIDGTKFQTPEILFRRIIFPDIGYEVPILAKPEALVNFRP